MVTVRNQEDPPNPRPNQDGGRTARCKYCSATNAPVRSAEKFSGRGMGVECKSSLLREPTGNESADVVNGTTEDGAAEV